MTFYASAFCAFRPRLRERQGITMRFMEKSLLFVALHMKAYPRILDAHLRLGVKRAHVTLFEVFQMLNHPRTFFDLTCLGSSFPFSTLSFIFPLCQFTQLFSRPEGSKRKKLTFPEVKLPSAKDTGPCL